MVTRLEETGWKDQVKGACKDVVKERGLDKITVEDLVQVRKNIKNIESAKKQMRKICRKLRLKEVKWFRMKLGKNCLKI